MALKPGIRATQTQKLSLTPGLRQSIAILAMSAGDLADLIKTETQENPLLALDTPSQATGGDFQFAIDTVAQPQTPAELLRAQLAHMRATDEVQTLAYYLAGDLTDEGYLPDPPAEIATMLKTDVKTVRAAIDLLQRCEPTGIGARDLRECLDLQLRALGVPDRDRGFILGNLGRFAEADWTALRRISGHGAEELYRMADIPRSLNPYPAEALAPRLAPPIHPDVLVTAQPGGGFAVEITGSLAPVIIVQPDQTPPARADDPTMQGYLKDCGRRANALVRAIESRRATILRVVQEIVARQHRFFAGGPAHLRPMRRYDIAQTLGLHPSTISRTVNNKALECAYGVLPLKFFFTNSVNDQGMSAYVVQQKIRRLVERETADQILSDAQIATLLGQSGVDIARRTVAKYRQCLKLPSSIRRRRSKRVL